jgi:hypothetical protein
MDRALRAAIVTLGKQDEPFDVGVHSQASTERPKNLYTVKKALGARGEAWYLIIVKFDWPAVGIPRATGRTCSF